MNQNNFIKRRIKATKEEIYVALQESATYITKDKRLFHEDQLDTNFISNVFVSGDKDKQIPYFVMCEIENLFKNYIPLHQLITMLPTGDDSPMHLGTYINALRSGNWEITITDWYGDRSAIEVIKHTTSKYTTWEDVIFYSIRDVFCLVNERYPGDAYIIKVLKRIKEFMPDYFNNSEFFKQHFKELYE